MPSVSVSPAMEKSISLKVAVGVVPVAGIAIPNRFKKAADCAEFKRSAFKRLLLETRILRKFVWL